VDYGLMGINSIHLKDLDKYGIDARDLMNPCVNIYVSAWLYAQKVRAYGNTWDAVGAYHSKTEGLRQKYASKIFKILTDWGIVQAAASNATAPGKQDGVQTAITRVEPRLRSQTPGANAPMTALKTEDAQQAASRARQQQFLAQVSPSQRAQVEQMLRRQNCPRGADASPSDHVLCQF
jgi:hypothetical protein